MTTSILKFHTNYYDNSHKIVSRSVMVDNIFAGEIGKNIYGEFVIHLCGLTPKTFTRLSDAKQFAIVEHHKKFN